MKTFSRVTMLATMVLSICSCHSNDDLIIHKDTDNKIYVSYMSSPSSVLPNGNLGADIYINRHLSDSVYYGMCFGNKTATINKNFDFRTLYLSASIDCIPSSHSSADNSSVRILAGHDTDYIVAMRIGAKDNADGDFPNSTNKFTGGFHGYDSETSGPFTPTMYEISKMVYVDGKPANIDTATYCDSVRVVVVNLIQGSNTEKADGSGRNILKQTITLYASAEKEDYDIDVQLATLEDIYMYQVNGLCFYNDFDYIQFIGKTASGYYPKGEVKRSEDKNVHTIRQTDLTYYFDVYMDLDCGLATGTNNDDDFNASIESACKSYFNLVSKTRDGMFLPQDSNVKFRGGYRFGLVK